MGSDKARRREKRSVWPVDMATIDGRRSTELYVFSLFPASPLLCRAAKPMPRRSSALSWAISASESRAHPSATQLTKRGRGRRMVQQRRNGFSNQKDFHLIRFCCRRRRPYYIRCTGLGGCLAPSSPFLEGGSDLGFVKQVQLAQPPSFISFLDQLSTLDPPLL